MEFLSLVRDVGEIAARLASILPRTVAHLFLMPQALFALLVAGDGATRA